MYTHTHTRTHTHTQMHTHTYTYAHTHTHIHTHTCCAHVPEATRDSVAISVEIAIIVGGVVDMELLSEN